MSAPRIGGVVLALLLASGVELAQAQPVRLSPLRPPRLEPVFGVRGFGEAASQQFLASDTFDAIFGDHRGIFGGGGGQFRWKNLIVEVSASRFKETGERVFVTNGEVFKLGIPSTITIRPIELTGAWRFPPIWRFRPYAGGGVGQHRYKETSRFAEASENVNFTERSFHVAGGGEIRLWRWIAAAGEVRYRSVADAIGEGGASREFSEEDLGGTSVALRLIFVAR